MIRVKLLAFQEAPDTLFSDAESRIEKLITPGRFELADSDPDVLFFLSGGSEKAALKHVSAGRFYMLVGSRHGNSWASATEVMAWLNGMNIPSLLLDEDEEGTAEILSHFIVVKQALDRLNGQRLGLIGQVSDWLVASAIPPGLLKARLGIDLVEIPWQELGHFSGYHPSGEFLDNFSGERQADLTETARVSEMLTQAIRERDLDAITVECFPMVQKEGVTACLPLARFNDLGIPAGCEGDITAIAGMMLCRELTGIVPWMANINRAAGDRCLFSHCTIAPGLVSGFSVTTHYETGKGTAIAGDFREDEVTIFRFDQALTKAFIASATITGRPRSSSACRTQIEVKLTADEVRLLKENPLGNHHLIFPGDCTRLLQSACMVLGISVQGK